MKRDLVAQEMNRLLKAAKSLVVEERSSNNDRDSMDESGFMKMIMVAEYRERDDEGYRAYAGHKKYITPNKRQMLPYFLNSSLPEQSSTPS